MGSTGNQMSNPNELLKVMEGLLEERNQAHSIREVEKIERKSNSIVSDAIIWMRESRCEPALVRKMIDLHGKIIMPID